MVRSSGFPGGSVSEACQPDASVDRDAGQQSRVMLYIYFATRIAWTWYVFIGSIVTLIVAGLASFAFAPASAHRRNQLAPDESEAPE